MLMNCDLSRIEVDSSLQDVESKRTDTPQAQKCNQINRLLKKIEGASRIQYYLINVSLPSASESKKRLIFGDVKNLSKYINRCTQQCRSLLETDAPKPESPETLDTMPICTPVRSEKDSSMATPGSFDRLLAKLISPTVSKGSQGTPSRPETSQSVFTPTTPPRRQNHYNLKQSGPDTIVLRSLTDWTDLESPDDPQFSVCPADEQKGEGCDDSYWQEEMHADYLDTNIIPPTGSFSLELPPETSGDNTALSDLNAAGSLSQAPLSPPRGGCVLNIKQHTEEESCSNKRPVKVLFTMRAHTAPPDPVLDNSPVPPLCIPEEHDHTGSPSSPPPPPPPLSDNSRGGQSWSPVNEAERGRDTMAGVAMPIGALLDVAVDSDDDEGSSPLYGESLAHTPSPSARDGPDLPRISPPHTPSMPETSDELQHNPCTPVVVQQYQRFHMVSGVSPVRAGRAVSVVGGANPALVKVQRSSEWTQDEIASVFSAAQREKRAHTATEADDPSGVQSKWMSRHRSHVHEGPRRGPVRGDGMPPNKLNLRQSWQLAQKGGSQSAVAGNLTPIVDSGTVI